jgi:hypothetical protein
MDRTERREQEIMKLATSALWYAWGQIDGRQDLKDAGFDTEHGIEFGRLYERAARDYAEEKVSHRHNVLDAWQEFILSKKRLGITFPLTIDDIDRDKRYERQLAAGKGMTP